MIIFLIRRDAEANGNKTTSFLDFTKYFDKQCHLLEVGLVQMNEGN